MRKPRVGADSDVLGLDAVNLRGGQANIGYVMDELACHRLIQVDTCEEKSSRSPYCALQSPVGPRRDLVVVESGKEERDVLEDVAMWYQM
jgi:hypothetical protein